MRHDLTLVGDDIDRSSQSLGFVFTELRRRAICVLGGGERLMILWTSQNKHVHSRPDDAMRCLPWPCGQNMQSHDLDSYPSATEGSAMFIMNFHCLHSLIHWKLYLLVLAAANI